MNKLDKLVEDKIKAQGWVKLLPTEKCETTQPHRFRYTIGTIDSVSIIQYGGMVGVYQGYNWREKYKKVDWDTPECDCQDCLLIQGTEALESNGNAIDIFVRQIEGIEPRLPVDIVHLQIDQEDNGYKKVSFLYKVIKGGE